MVVGLGTRTSSGPNTATTLILPILLLLSPAIPYLPFVNLKYIGLDSSNDKLGSIFNQVTSGLVTAALDHLSVRPAYGQLVTSISLAEINNTSPLWGVEAVEVSGTTTGAVSGSDTVSINWGDSSAPTLEVGILSDGSWGPVTHIYSEAAISTSPNNIVATLVNSTGGVIATATTLSPKVVGANMGAGSSVTVPAGGTTYMYGATEGGAFNITAIDFTQDLAVRDPAGQQSVVIGHSQSNTGTYSESGALFPNIGGIGVEGVPSQQFMFNNSGFDSINATFNLAKDSLVVMVAAASQNDLPVSLTPAAFTIDADNSNCCDTVLLAHANLHAGANQFSISYTFGNPGNSDPTSRAIGVALYAFPNGSGSASVNVQPHPTVLTLNQIRDIVQGTSFTVSGQLTDAATGDPLGNEVIAFSGSGATPTLHSAVTNGIRILAPAGGASDLTIGSCLIGSENVSGCSPNVDANGGPIENTIVNYVELPVGSQIEMPPATVAAKLRVQAVDSITQSGIDVHFTVHVNYADGTGGTDFNGTISAYDLDLDLATTQTLQHGIGSITVTSIDNPESFVPVTSITSYDPAADPPLKYLVTFDNLLAGAVSSPLILDEGAYFSTGTAPASVANGLSVQASFGGDVAGGFAASTGVSQTYSTLPLTAGTVGETPPTSIGAFRGIGATNLGPCAITNPDPNHDGLCGSWSGTTGGIPVNLFSGSDIGDYNLGYQYTVSFLQCPSSSPCTDAPKVDEVTHASTTSTERNVYVELAYMQNHAPSAAALGPLVQLFHNHNINLHIVRQNAAITHSTSVTVWSDGQPCTVSEVDDFQCIKANNFAFPTGASGFALGHPSFQALENVGTLSSPNWQWEPARGILGHVEMTSSGTPDQQVLTAKSQIYHFGLYAHNIGVLSTSNGCGFSGLALVDGADFMIGGGCGYSGNAEASYAPMAGVTGDGQAMSTQEERGTFLHELGHNFGLNHGGPQTVNGVVVSSADYTMNCKPNYLSAMSYSRQLPRFLGANWVADYSNYASPTDIGQLNEASLTESTGLTISSGTQYIVWGTPGSNPSFHAQQISSTASSIDWDGDGGASDTVATDINNLGIPGCNDGQKTDVMNSYNDWKNLVLDFRLNPETLYGENIFYPDPQALPEFTLDGSVKQLATPNSTPPTVTARMQPMPDSSGWIFGNATISFDCTAAEPGTTIASCTSPVTLSVPGANQQVQGKAVDTAGSSSTVSVSINIDLAPVKSVTILANPGTITQGQSSFMRSTVSASSSLSSLAFQWLVKGPSDSGYYPITGANSSNYLFGTSASNLVGQYSFELQVTDALGRVVTSIPATVNVKSPELCSETQSHNPISQTTVNVGSFVLTRHAEKHLFCVLNNLGDNILYDNTLFTNIREDFIPPGTSVITTHAPPAPSDIVTISYTLVTCAKDQDEPTAGGPICETAPTGKTIENTQNCTEVSLGFPQHMDSVPVASMPGVIKTIESQKELFRCTVQGVSGFVDKAVTLWTIQFDNLNGPTFATPHNVWLMTSCTWHENVNPLLNPNFSMNCQSFGPFNLLG